MNDNNLKLYYEKLYKDVTKNDIRALFDSLNNNNNAKFEINKENEQIEILKVTSTSEIQRILKTNIPVIFSEINYNTQSLFQNYIRTTDIKDNLILINSNNQTIQVFNGSEISYNYAKSLSFENLLSFFDLENCLNKIINYYNLEYKKLNSSNFLNKEDIIIFKIDDNPRMTSPFSNYNGYNARIYLYNTKSPSKENINMNICSEDKLKVFLPVKPTYSSPTPINITSASFYYNKYQSDIYNKNDKIYNDICFKFYDNQTDLTVNDRRKEIFPNILIKCSHGCTFSNLESKMEYSICLCESYYISNINMNYIDHKLEDLIVENINLFSCIVSIFGEINSLKENYGFIFSLAIILSIVVLYFVLEVVFKNTFKRKLNRYDKYDQINNKQKFDNNHFKNEDDNKYASLVKKDNFNKDDKSENKKNDNSIISVGINNNQEEKKDKVNYSENLDIKTNYAVIDKNISKDKDHLEYYTNNLPFYKNLIESDGCYFNQIDVKLKNKIVEIFDEKNYEDNSEGNIMILNNSNFNDKSRNDDNVEIYNNKYKFKLKFDKKIIDEKKKGSINKNYFLKKNKKCKKIKAKFIKNEICDDKILNAEASLFDIDDNIYNNSKKI